MQLEPDIVGTIHTSKVSLARNQKRKTYSANEIKNEKIN